MSKDNHGQTPAAWTGTFLLIAASIISTFALTQNNWNMFWQGIALAVFSTILWIVWEKVRTRVEIKFYVKCLRRNPYWG